MPILTMHTQMPAVMNIMNKPLKTAMPRRPERPVVEISNRAITPAVMPHESARENLPTIGEKNSPEQIPCFVQYHYTKRRVAPPFFLA